MASAVRLKVSVPERFVSPDKRTPGGFTSPG